MAEVAKERLGGMGVILVVVVLFAGGGGLLHVHDQPKNGIRVEKLEADLKGRLPLGSSWEEAEAWFTSHGIKPNVLMRGHESRVSELLATVPNDTFLESAQIIISLTFSPDGRLERCAVWRYVQST
jgi:hypothetical protein